jgi:hypothetical protein
LLDWNAGGTICLDDFMQKAIKKLDETKAGSSPPMAPTFEDLLRKQKKKKNTIGTARPVCSSRDPKSRSVRSIAAPHTVLSPLPCSTRGARERRFTTDTELGAGDSRHTGSVTLAANAR